jgi:integrase
MAHSHFNLHKRHTKGGKLIYYVQFYDEEGNRLTARSSGQSSKAAAKNWAEEQWKQGNIYSHKDITLDQYVERKNFWIWDECEYLKRRLARGRVSPGYADAMRTYTVLHVLPHFGNKSLRKINETMVDNWFIGLLDKVGRHGKTLSRATANHCLKAFRIILAEAERDQLIPFNPAEKVSSFEEDSSEKDVYKIDEIRRLFHPDNFKELWKGDLRQYTINLLGASTGIRISEARGLVRSGVHDHYISINQKWSNKYGIGDPKSQSFREIPIPLTTFNSLRQLMHISPYKEPMDFVFWGEQGRRKPMSDSVIRERLYYALSCIGVSEEERIERDLSYHTWRHTFNSLMRGRIHDSKLQRLTGHRTQEMVERYTHYRIEDYRDVLEIQEEYF